MYTSSTKPSSLLLILSKEEGMTPTKDEGEEEDGISCIGEEDHHTPRLVVASRSPFYHTKVDKYESSLRSFSQLRSSPAPVTATDPSEVFNNHGNRRLKKDEDEEEETQYSSLYLRSVMQGMLFPFKLHRVLNDAETNGFDHIVSWDPDGKAFKVRDHDAFASQIMPKYFDQTKYKSFQRQINLYGFSRVSKGAQKGSYNHECFVRGEPHLCLKMKRQKIKSRSSSQEGTTTQRGVATSGRNCTGDTHLNDGDEHFFEGKRFFMLPDEE